MKLRHVLVAVWCFRGSWSYVTGVGGAARRRLPGVKEVRGSRSLRVAQPAGEQASFLGGVRAAAFDGDDAEGAPKKFFFEDPETLIVVVCYFLQGALGLSRLALNFYLKDELHLSPGDLAALTGLASAPWARARALLEVTFNVTSMIEREAMRKKGMLRACELGLIARAPRCRRS